MDLKTYVIGNVIAITDFYGTKYLATINFFLLVTVITLLLITISYILSLATKKNIEQLNEYECGFEPFDNATRNPFNVQFYIVGILFLLFDVEIALLFPWVINFNYLSSVAFYAVISFIGLLTLGFFYEWHLGALNWIKKT